MLPSRLFRNTGLPPALRSLITPRGSLPPTIAVQLRLRLGVLQGSVNTQPTVSAYSTSGPPTASSSSASSSSSGSTTPTPSPPLSRAASSASKRSSTMNTEESSGLTPANNGNSLPLPEKLELKLSMTFTCTVKGCGHRSTHEFTKRAYEKGIVLVECPSCKNRHLIADHLGWFKESTQDGKLRTVEDLLRAKGEKVRRGRIDAGGVVEYAEG